MEASAWQLLAASMAPDPTAAAAAMAAAWAHQASMLPDPIASASTVAAAWGQQASWLPDPTASASALAAAWAQEASWLPDPTASASAVAAAWAQEAGWLPDPTVSASALAAAWAQQARMLPDPSASTSVVAAAWAASASSTGSPDSSSTAFSAAASLVEGDLEFAKAVAHVKAVQKNSNGREMWNVFCDARGGKKDPAHRQHGELAAFLAQADPTGVCLPTGPAPAVGVRPERRHDTAAVASKWASAASAMPAGPVPESSPEHRKLMESVKALQRRSGGHDLWRGFCERRGGGKRDPAARSVQDLQDFLMEVELGGGQLIVTAPMTERDRLVMHVKQGQRTSDDFKQAWWRHCAVLGGAPGAMDPDPSKHTLESLQHFMAAAPDAPLSEEKDPEHEQLVQHVKQGQRTSEEFRGAWYTFCSDKGTQKNDPARHDKAFLQDFMASPLVQSARPNQQPRAAGGWKGSDNRFAPY